MIAETPRTLFEKIWDEHVVYEEPGKQTILYIDLHLVHEVTSPQAFEGLRVHNRAVRRPERTVATQDHNVPTTDRSLPIADPISRQQIETLRSNCKEFGVRLYDLDSPKQGIVHVIGPELGLTQPGMTIVCGDSHTATHGAFGALAFGIGTSEVEHVLATQTLLQTRPRTYELRVDGSLQRGVTAKDLILYLIGQISTSGGTGYAIEYTGQAIRELNMEQRMTICNMSIEAGARAGMIAVDDTTIDYVRGREFAPDDFEAAAEEWKSYRSDPAATYDRVDVFDAQDIDPQITWGTNPGQVTGITGTVPCPDDFQDEVQQQSAALALEYMDLKAGIPMQDIAIDRVFIGSCTNSRIGDLREAADVVRGRKIADSVDAMVVPGSGQIKHQAETEGLDRVFVDAGFQWREAGCSMCLGMNPDILSPGQRCASTSNRNFEGRQGRGGRTHLVSPSMAAAAAIEGRFVDIRDWDTKAESMQVFQSHTGMVVTMDRSNVDTDQIIPKQFLKRIERTGFGQFLFFDWRFDEEGQPQPDFKLNLPRFQNATILVARQNFGSGSSREHAVWALSDYGFRCVIAESFADIFYNNCSKNGLLPVVLPTEDVETIHQRTAENEGYKLTVDLVNQQVADELGLCSNFEIDAFRKQCFLEGLDQIALTLQQEDKITAFEAARG